MKQKNNLNKIANKHLKDKKGNKGITLIALVITIIVLIILAGITINLLMGDNGILTRAKGAKEEFNKSKMLEDTTLLLLDYSAEHELTGITLADYLTKNNVSYETEDGKIRLTQESYVITIDPITLELDGPTKTNKVAQIILNSNIIEPGDSLNVTLTYGEEVDATNCKYKFEKSDVEVTKDSMSAASNVTGTTITIPTTQATEKGEYYFYLLVAYKDGTSELKKVKVTVDVEPTGISLNKTSLTLDKGNTENLIASVIPEGAEQGIDWSTSDSSIVTVNNEGLVTAKAVGTAQIIVTSTQKTSVKGTCIVTVPEHLLEGISLSVDTSALTVGQNAQITATVTPENTTENIVWENTNTQVATVTPSEDGRYATVRANARGTTTITAKGSKSNSVSDSIEITVTQPATITYMVDGSTYSTNTNAQVGDTIGTLPTNPSVTGRTFKGWFDEGGNQYFSSSTVNTVNLTLYARWTCGVTFESNGGSSVATQTVDYGSTAIQPTNPTKQNNVLVGWYTDSALTQSYSFSTAVTEDITLYAKWRFEGQLSGVSLGDYVDIGVTYTCTMSSGYTGWRVLDDGSESGVVKLISAGCPLKYQFDGNDARPSAEFLSNLYSSTLNTGVNYGRFTSSGFASSTYDMTSVFGGSNSFVDVSAGTVSIYAPKYSMVHTSFTNDNHLNGTIWAIDTSYWLASCGREGTINSSWYTVLDYVYKNPTVGNTLSCYNGHMGVRMIVTLKSNVRVSSSNTGNGSASTPWQLALTTN